jgi:serine/threonine-protein kinase
MSLQQDPEQSSSHQAVAPLDFTGKPPSSLGPKTVVNLERRPMVPVDSRELPPSALVKRRRLFAGDDVGSSESFTDGQPPLGPAGVELAHFVIEEPIGRGGMGAVYRAVDQRLQRVVALKILAPEQSHTQNAVQRFINEARASAQLDHDNIARVFFVGEDDGLHFIAYEYVTGTNIRELIGRSGRLAPAEAINYTLQIAAALKHTSAAGVIHRDVKPSNIIVTPVGRAKLVDLGLARKEYSESADELTVAGTTLGTFDYISPEQAKDPRDVDVRSDIYSLGCTLYHMLTGEPPYPEGTMYQKLLKHDGKEPADPARKNNRVPPELSAVVKKMMASDPGRRQRDADELIGDLMAVAGQLGIRTVSPDGLVWAAEMTQHPPGFLRRNFGWMATAAALVLIVFLLDRFGDKLNFGLSDIDSNSVGQSKLVADGENSSTPPGDIAANTGPGSAGGKQPLPDGKPQSEQYDTQSTGPSISGEGGAAIKVQRTEFPPARGTPPDAVRSPTIPEATEPETPTNDAANGALEPPTKASVKPTVPAETTDIPPKTGTFPAVEEPPQIVLTTPGESEPKPFNTLEAACSEAVDGSVIVLRYNGPRTDAEKPMRLADKRITIRGEKGFRPVIEFRPVTDSAGEMTTRLITLIGGFGTSVELINVDIDVILPENSDPALEWALFSLQGAEQVRLTDVRVTFENSDGPDRFNNVDGFLPPTLIELTSGPSTNLTDMKMMKEKPPGARSEFEIKLTDTLVRGGCDLFHVVHTRPGRFSCEQSVIAIDGTLLVVVGDLEMPDEEADLELQIEHVTGLLGNGLIRWHTGSDPRDVLPVNVTSRNNIFSTNADRPLIAMNGSTDPDNFRKLLRWSGERNFYDRFVMFWTITSDLDMVETTPYDFVRWNSFWGNENDPHADPVVWESNWWKKPFVELTVDDFRLDADAADNPAVGGALNDGSDAGADLQKLTRAPQAEEIPKSNVDSAERSD